MLRYTRGGTVRKTVRKLAILFAGVVFALLGLAGVILPVMPGIPFLLISLLLLSREFAWAERLLHGASVRFPVVGRLVQRVRGIPAPAAFAKAS